VSEPHCAVCRRTVTPDGDHVEVEIVTDPREEPWGTTYYFHRSCWIDADPTDEWGEPA
jgi:hypothetical protein